jgi:hypothetical protein
VHETPRDPSVRLVLVGFSPPDRLAALARHLDWPGLVLADPPRRLYGALGLGRAPLWRVYSPRTLLMYARAVVRRERLRPPVEDTRQLGADAVVVDGSVVRLWRPRSPDDRPEAREVLAEAAELLGG